MMSLWALSELYRTGYNDFLKLGGRGPIWMGALIKT